MTSPTRSHARLAPLTAALAALVLLLAASSANATVVQDRQPGDDLIAHRWSAPASGPQTLTVVAPSNVDWTTMTLLDFDRDGRPDAMVDFAWSPGQQDVVWQLYRLAPSAMAPDLGTNAATCFTPTADDSTLVAGGHIPEVRRAHSWAVVLTRDFGADLGSAFSGLVDYQPILTSIFTPQARGLGSAYVVKDILPNAADPVTAPGDAAHQCSGLVGGRYAQGIQVAPAKGSDRGQASFAPSRRQAMFTDAIATDPAQPQLVESDIAQWDASQTTSDLTADIPNPTYVTYHPSDLVLTLRADHPLDTVTYLVPDGGKQPIGLVTTTGSANQAAGGATLHVQLHGGLSALSDPDASTGNGCYPRTALTNIGGHDWGAEPVAFDVPLTAVRADDGTSAYRAEISLDQLLGIGNGTTGDRPAFRWATTSAPAQYNQPLYTPDVAGLDELDQPLSPCTVPSTSAPGTQLRPSQMVRMDTTLPSASLTSSPSAPHAGDAVTLTASTSASGASYRFDPTVGPSSTWGSLGASPSATHIYGSGPAVARVYLLDAAGTGAMASTTIATDNPPPSAALIREPTSPTPPFVLGTSAPTVSWDDTSADTLGGFITARHWDLHKVNYNGSGAITCDADASAHGTACAAGTFSHTFVPGEQGDWVLFLTVTDDGGAQATTSTTFHVVQPPIAQLDTVTPRTILIDTSVFPVTGSFQIHMRTASDGSLGSEGPLTYFYAGAQGSGATPPFTPFDFIQGSATFDGAEHRTGIFPVQARVEDTDGRVARTPPFDVVVRGAGDDPPTASLTIPPVVGGPRSGETQVTFDASASVLNNPEGTTATPAHYVFDFGDGSAPLDSASAVVQHAYAGSGHYIASVSVLDDRFVPTVPSDPGIAELDVAPGATDANAPVAKGALLHPGDAVFAKSPVVLTAAASTVADGPARFAWDLDGDGAFETDTGTEATVTTTYATPGTRHVRVRVTDAKGRVTVSDDVFVGVNAANDQPPFVSLTAPDTVTLSNGRVAVALDASQSVGRNLDPSLTFAWDLDGNGTYETRTASNAHATAVFTSAGEHTVRVLVSDAYHNAGAVSKTIYVRGAADVAANCRSNEQYRTLTYGKVQLAACWSQVARPNAGPLWFARDNVNIDGMLITGPVAGTAKQQAFSDCSGACATAQSGFNLQHGGAVAFDPSDGQLASNMPFSWKATNGDQSFVLNQGALDLVLPSAGDADGIELAPPSGGSFLTLKVAKQAEIRFPQDGEATIGLTMHMPIQLPGASGDLTLRSTQTQGLIVDKLRIDVTAGLLKDQLKLARMRLEYDRAEALWSGSAELGVPGIRDRPQFGLTVAVSIKDGGFHSIYGAVNGLDIDLGEGIFLQRIAAGVGVDPLDFQGGMGISAGPQILGHQILSADGDIRLTFPSAAAPYTLFQIAGVTRLADLFDLTRGVARFTTDGFVEARGGMSRASFIGYFDATIGGWFTLHDFELSGDAQAGLLLLGDRIKLLGAKAVASKKGIAACGEIPVLNLGGGLGYHWGGSFDTFTGCDLGPYSAVRPAGIPSGFIINGPDAGTARAAAAPATRPTSAPTMTLPARLRSVGVTLHGKGGAPKVKLFDAKGRVVLDATKEQLTTRALVQLDDRHATTSILWKAPPAGKLLVLAAPGSPAVTSVGKAIDRGLQRVRASFSGTGAKRMLSWSVAPALQHGQQLALAEQLPAGASVAPGGGAPGAGAAGRALVTTLRSRGSIRFVPRAGHGEARIVSATILTGGLGRPPQVAARFRAPRLVTPSAPIKLALRRHGRTVTATWAGGASLPRRWRVQLQAGSARSTRTELLSASRSLSLSGVAAVLPVTATVQGVAASRATGPARRARLAPGQLRSGTSAAADAQPRRLTARRSATRLLVSWTRGPSPVRAYALTVTIGRRVVRLLAAPSRPQVVVRGLPRTRTAVKVQLRAQRLDGKQGAALTLSAKR
ncbi:MAG: hypothetical protein JWQ48_1325 [Conexibacter sp.]|nr:hypothetical protein [Conexibacter sp.]